jgi:hypothetical protein
VWQTVRRVPYVKCWSSNLSPKSVVVRSVGDRGQLMVGLPPSRLESAHRPSQHMIDSTFQGDLLQDQVHRLAVQSSLFCPLDSIQYSFPYK